VDDFLLLLGNMLRLGLPGIIDKHLVRHGWIAAIWLAHMRPPSILSLRIINESQIHFREWTVLVDK
jgi:hypothetical protein